MFETLSGQNHFELHKALKSRTEAFVDEFGELAYEQLDASNESVGRLMEAVTSLPFLATHKLVVLRDAGANKQFQELLVAEALDLPDVTTVLLIEPQVDKRGKYYKWLKKHTTFHEFMQLDERKLASWVVDFAIEQGTSISNSDAAYLVQRIGLNQVHLAHELEKLALVSDHITRDTIDVMTEPTPQSKIFDLLEAAFSGNTRRAMSLYVDQRAQKVEPQEIIAMLGWQLRQIALAKAAGKKYDLVRDAKMSPYGATKATNIANTLTLSDIRNLLDSLTILDVKSKRQPIHLDQALQAFILTI